MHLITKNTLLWNSSFAKSLLLMNVNKPAEYLTLCSFEVRRLGLPPQQTNLTKPEQVGPEYRGTIWRLLPGNWSHQSHLLDVSTTKMKTKMFKKATAFLMLKFAKAFVDFLLLIKQKGMFVIKVILKNAKNKY